jgi:hypothetical protein
MTSRVRLVTISTRRVGAERWNPSMEVPSTNDELGVMWLVRQFGTPETARIATRKICSSSDRWHPFTEPGSSRQLIKTIDQKRVGDNESP